MNHFRQEPDTCQCQALREDKTEAAERWNARLQS
jgi:hypothetical protein